MRPVLLLILNFNFSSGAVTKLYVMVPENDDRRIIRNQRQTFESSLRRTFEQINRIKVYELFRKCSRIEFPKVSKNNLILKLKSLDYPKTTSKRNILISENVIRNMFKTYLKNTFSLLQRISRIISVYSIFHTPYSSDTNNDFCF